MVVGVIVSNRAARLIGRDRLGRCRAVTRLAMAKNNVGYESTNLAPALVRQGIAPA